MTFKGIWMASTLVNALNQCYWSLWSEASASALPVMHCQSVEPCKVAFKVKEISFHISIMNESAFLCLHSPIFQLFLVNFHLCILWFALFSRVLIQNVWIINKAYFVFDYRKLSIPGSLNFSLVLLTQKYSITVTS